MSETDNTNAIMVVSPERDWNHASTRLPELELQGVTSKEWLLHSHRFFQDQEGPMPHTGWGSGIDGPGSMVITITMVLEGLR